MGRHAEFDRLASVADAVASGDRRVVLVQGEAGVGKSRLLAEFIALTRARGCCALVGRCLELGEEIWPLAALRELLGDLVDELDDATLDLVLGGSRRVLGRLVPEFDTAPESSVVDQDQLCESVIAVLQRLALRRPIVVVIEDLHWADTSTRALFSLLARSSRPSSMLLVGSYRSDELSRRHPLRPVLAEVVRHARADRIDLEPFDRDCTAELAAEITDDAIDRTVIDDIHRSSGGNAFFIEELVAARSAGRTTLPESLRDVVLARTVGMPERVIDLLPLIAVAGRSPPSVIARAAGIDASMLAAALDELVTVGLVVFEGDDVRFRHELAREVFVEEIAPEDRATMHADLAASIAVLRPDRVGEIARHWSATDHARPALVSLVAAGRRAMLDGAPSEAETYFRRALDRWGVVDDTEVLVGSDMAAVLVEAATAAYHARHLDDAIALALRALDELGGRDPWREGDVWLRLRAMYRFSNRWNDCRAALTHALEVIPTSPPSSARVEALADAALGHWYQNRAEEALACAEQALDAASLLGEPDAIVLARNALQAALAIADPTGESALEVARATLAMCGAGVSPEHRMIALNGLTNSLAVAGRYAELVDVAATGVDLARASGRGGPLGAAMGWYWLGSLVALGRWSEAEVVNGELSDLIADQPPQDVLPYLETAFVRQGRLDEARPTIERIRAVVRRPDFWAEDVCELGATIVEFDSAAQRSGDVVPFVDDLLERCRTTLAYGAWSLIAAGIAALADAPSDDHARLLRVAHRWLGHLEASGRSVGREESLQRDRALAELSRLQRRSDPTAWLNVAIGSEDLGIRYGAAYARWRRAEALLAGVGGRSSAARWAAADELRPARALAVNLAAHPLLREIDTLARQARLDLDRPLTRPEPVRPRADALGLTRREHDVLELISCGLSNGAIGERLFISRKTASVHVSNILRKLGVANRIEAATIHHRLQARSNGLSRAAPFDAVPSP